MQLEREKDSVRNADLEWDDFDPESYRNDNYRMLREDDQIILERVRDFFARAAGEPADRSLRGLDMGTGSNLYPALAMLPWCKQISLIDYSANNVSWLRQEIVSYSPEWNQFWDVLRQNPVYGSVADPRRELAERAVVWQGSVFDLPGRQWDIGTMFFVACSISQSPDEFQRASERFLGALVPGAPFAMAYMEKSSGYTVGGIRFPAVSLDLSEILDSLEGRASGVTADRIVVEKMLREGYDAMVIVMGHAAADTGGLPAET
ncbi:methyltransferase [Frankia sp. R43]|uniref:SCO2525 family SAM-dependent methyltransferase n=1 Tax=Frankia sp. R43 TaxID=269536 RepID=UPI0006CA5048|nr:SCO2525 family SAM-dependent methyltransferase [Frankia sp. R43]KPM51042.1 methyltransferase [Frankia sp. R43]